MTRILPAGLFGVEAFAVEVTAQTQPGLLPEHVDAALRYRVGRPA